MKNVLEITVAVYAENIQELLDAPIEPSHIERFLPGADSTLIADLKTLVKNIPQLAKLFVDYIEDTNNLLEDRARVSVALNYLIMPFDVISDNNGIVGLMDDAVIMMNAAKSLKVQTPEIQKIVCECAPIASRLEDFMPSWLVESLGNFEKILIQMKIN
jgi:uncharacterized membrane protein YkvA (DUF1232 family)